MCVSVHVHTCMHVCVCVCVCVCVYVCVWCSVVKCSALRVGDGGVHECVCVCVLGGGGCLYVCLKTNKHFNLVIINHPQVDPYISFTVALS